MIARSAKITIRRRLNFAASTASGGPPLELGAEDEFNSGLETAILFSFLVKTANRCPSTMETEFWFKQNLSCGTGVSTNRSSFVGWRSGFNERERILLLAVCMHPILWGDECTCSRRLNPL